MAQTLPPVPPDFDDVFAYREAVRLAAGLGHVSAAVSSCNRALNSSPLVTAAGQFDPGTRFQLRRLFSAPSVKIPIYFFSSQHRTAAVQGKELLSEDDYFNAYTPHELSALLSILYLYRRFQTKNIDVEEISRVKKIVAEYVEVGAILGKTFPKMGLADGMLVGGIRWLGMIGFLIDDPKGFREHRIQLKVQDKVFDLGMERLRWGCTHLDISTILLINLGFAKDYCVNFHTGTQSPSDKNLGKESLRFRMLAYWIEALHRGAPPPTIRGEEEYHSGVESLDSLMDQCKKIRLNSVPQTWLGKGKESVSPHTHPQLFEGQEIEE